MSIKIAINGFGRIGKPTFRRLLSHHPGMEVVAINDLADIKTLAHLLQYDSVHGTYEKPVSCTKQSLVVGGKEFRVFCEQDPEKLPWKQLKVDVVLESTGHFTRLADARKHLRAGATRVIISAVCKKLEVPTFVLGVNADQFDPQKNDVIDMGSCTTNCLAPVVKVLHDHFTIMRGFMTTVHSYTNNQRILDLPHKDLRRARAAAVNIIPTSSGATEAIGKVIPDIAGKLDGIALRVPTPDVSVLDLVVEVKKPASVKKVNDAFKKAAQGKKMKGILAIEEEPLVSSDYIGSSFSAVVDASFTMTHGNLVKIIAWYDNEYGYACRLAELAEYIGKKP